MSKKTSKRILVVGDLHAPFTEEGYLKFCKDVYKQHKCNHVVFIGDIIDNHYSSYHETDPDGYGAGEELRRATDQLAAWHKAFPCADVCIGNHDRMAARKVYTAGLSSKWLRDMNDVLQVPTWTFGTSFEHDGVTYIHGDKRVTARTAALRTGKSSVQGHRHNESYVWFNPEANTFGMQVGTGVDTTSYAMAYAQESMNVLSCGVVIDGKLPVIVPYHG